jgi:hypothetical protein
VLAASIIALTMEEASTPETSVKFYQTSRHNISEGSHLQTRCRENLKSQIVNWFKLIGLCLFT